MEINTAALERYHLPSPEHQIFTSSRIPAPAFSFPLYTELSIPGDKDVLTRFQFGLDSLKEVLHDVYGLVLWETEFCLYRLYDVCLGQSHVLCTFL